MTEFEQLVELCTRLGSSSSQAEVMARQLAKRAEQLERDRGISRVEAMAYLLQLLVKGHSGEQPPGFEGGAPPPTQPRDSLKRSEGD